MGFFSWIGNIFGAGKNAETIIEGAVSGIDALILTDEEKIQYKQGAYELWLKLQEITANESSARSISRRVLAVMIMGSFLILLFVAAVAYPFSIIYAKFLLSLAAQLNTLVLGVGGFYFATHLIRGWKKDK